MGAYRERPSARLARRRVATLTTPIAVFAVAAALLLNSLQFSATTLAYAATPSERLDYVPEATSNTGLLGVIRRRQWEELDLRTRYIRRARFCYNTGLLAFLGGLGLIIVPHRSWPWPAGQLIGVIAIGVSLLFEALWILSNARWPKWLFPRASKGDPPAPNQAKNTCRMRMQAICSLVVPVRIVPGAVIF